MAVTRAHSLSRAYRGDTMATKLMVVFVVTVAAASEHSSHVVVSVGTEAYGAAPYSYYPQAVYYPQHSYPHQPVYPHHPQPSYGHHEPAVPACAANTTKPWCLEDSKYPLYDIQHALQYNAHHVLDLYADVADLNTALSVERPKTLDEETYLCPSSTAYVRPLRAINTDGKWRVIVNNVEVHYQTLTQTARVEECLTAGDACPLVPECYGSKCLQKSIYHRFLVYDPYDYYLPFSIESFALPASCACLLSAYTLDH